MAVRLIDMAQGLEDPIAQGVVETFAETSDIANALMFEDAPRGIYSFLQRTSLGDSGFRGLNEGFSESTSTREQVDRRTYPMGGDADLDVKIVDEAVNNIRGDEVAAKVVDMAQLFDFTFVKGTGDFATKDFKGLQAQLTGDQVVDNGNAGLKLDKLNETIDRVKRPGGLLMNRATARRMADFVNNTSTHSIRSERDDFGRRVQFYQDLPILIADPIGHARNPLPFTEAPSSSSIYVLDLSMDGVFAIQNGPPEVVDLGQVDDKPVYRHRIYWNIGLVMKDPAAAARLSGITDAATTAS